MKKVILSIFFALILVAFFCLSYFLIIINWPEHFASQKFVVEKGQGVKQIAYNLKEQGLISNQFIFESYVYLIQKEKNFIAAEYFFDKNQSIKKIVSALVAGEAISNEKEIKIIEGWNLWDMANYFVSQGIATKEEFFQKAGQPAKFDLLKKKYSAPQKDNINFLLDDFINHEKKANLEGYLFPDTYRVYKNAWLDEIIKKCLDNLAEKLTSELREKIKQSGYSLNQILTMASIIEKEVNKDEDRRLIAGIFYQRLKINMPLQADSTLDYLINKTSAQLGLDDLKINSPYNTYRFQGLPPGPICSPGLSSILAAIEPQESDYLYFLTTANGETIFSETLKEHNAAKAKYLK